MIWMIWILYVICDVSICVMCAGSRRRSVSEQAVFEQLAAVAAPVSRPEARHKVYGMLHLIHVKAITDIHILMNKIYKI